MGLSAIVAVKGGNVKEKVKWRHADCDEFPRHYSRRRHSRETQPRRPAMQAVRRRVRGMATTVIVSAFTTERHAPLLRNAPPWSATRGSGSSSASPSAPPTLLRGRQRRRACRSVSRRTRSTTDASICGTGPDSGLSIAVCISGWAELMHNLCRSVPVVAATTTRRATGGGGEEGPEESKDGAGRGDGGAYSYII